MDKCRKVDQTEKSSIDIELLKYQGLSAISSNPLEFWKKHAHDLPILSKIVSKILALPASSASSERRFSIAGKVVRPEKSRQSPATLLKFSFLNNNKNL